MGDSENIAKATDLATEKTKQLITLCTGIIAITISFIKDVLNGVPRWAVVLLLLAWITYFASIIYGVKLLGRIAGSLQAEPLNFNTLLRPEIIRSARWQERLFLAGIGFSLAFAIWGVIAMKFGTH